MFHLKEKQTTFCIIIRRMTIEKGARAVGILRQGAGIRQVRRFYRKCLQIPVSCLQLSQLTRNQTELIIFRSLAFQTLAFNDQCPIRTGNVIDTYCCSIPTALVLSAVVIRRMMKEMLSVFLFSEAFSK